MKILTLSHTIHRPKFFSDDWLKCVEFKGWLQKVPNNGHKAHCTACKVLLNSGKSDLLKHVAGKKNI
ncbi:unnamed protein product [Macrosiphum euphorbiae]|uniref:BED-type domain-containing protein n=1 Tax=Macrosiphum euphorbiae TaxID=13131 RepID=A0AAV0WPS4_9HEMI|nr:unnamed protein product [Macrosiphum euphorbiae]